MSRSSSSGGDGSSTSTTQPLADSDARRHSVEEDLFYEQLMAGDARSPPADPPPYSPLHPGGPSWWWSSWQAVRANNEVQNETLPSYSTEVKLAGVWERKLEITDVVRPAEDRQWRHTYVELRGTSLKFYDIRKEWGWDRAREWAISPSPDNPLWARKAGLIRAYNLQHAEVGIAADYKKRRHVIRLRLETDQLLIACVGADTFVRWLHGLFAAVSIAHPLDEREYPQDQSVPRSQRARRGRAHRSARSARTAYPIPTPRPLSQLQVPDMGTSGQDGEINAGVFSPLGEVALAGLRERLPYSPSLSSSLVSLNPDVSEDVDPWPSSEHGQSSDHLETPPLPAHAHRAGTSSPLSRGPSERSSSRRSTLSASAHRIAGTAPAIDTSRAVAGSAASTADGVNGKWTPTPEKWTHADDLRYARLCFDMLLFRSPRKSDYVMQRNTKWFVDWATGRMVRVLPPTYGEIDRLSGAGPRGQLQQLQGRRRSQGLGIRMGPTIP